MEATENNAEEQLGGHYSLWLVPDTIAERQFAEAIDYLSERFPGPRFTPHITLLSGLSGQEEDLVAIASKLANELTSFSVTTAGLAMEPYYFRNFYLKLESSASFLLAYQRANQAFKKTASSDFRPHVSLYYGTASRDDRISMGEEIHTQLPGKLGIDKLYLVHTTLAVPNWRIISRYELRTPD